MALQVEQAMELVVPQAALVVPQAARVMALAALAALVEPQVGQATVLGKL